jgi:hypothetical protein
MSNECLVDVIFADMLADRREREPDNRTPEADVNGGTGSGQEGWRARSALPAWADPGR